jgi:MFS family permease
VDLDPGARPAVAVPVVVQEVELGGGPVELSPVSGAHALGVIVTALLGGVLADRVPRKRLLVGVLTPVFLVAGLVPLLFGAVGLVVGRLGPAELAYPLDAADEVPMRP